MWRVGKLDCWNMKDRLEALTCRAPGRKHLLKHVSIPLSVERARDRQYQGFHLGIHRGPCIHLSPPSPPVLARFNVTKIGLVYDCATHPMDYECPSDKERLQLEKITLCRLYTCALRCPLEPAKMSVKGVRPFKRSSPVSN